MWAWIAIISGVAFFFFSSRRRHTRCGRDWSSDVCSSDLPTSAAASAGVAMGVAGSDAALETADVALMADELLKRSEERRVGKEGGGRGGPHHLKKKNK